MKKNGFQLHKVKMRKDLGIGAEFSQSIGAGDSGVIRKKNNVNCSAAAHPDLVRAISRLRSHVAAIHGIIPVSLVQKNFEDMSESEQKRLQEVVESITITGITFIGTDESDQKYIVSCSREVLANGYVGFATPTIAADDSRYEASGEFTELLEEIADEVYLYVEEQKYAQLSLPLTFGGTSDSDDVNEGNIAEKAF